MLQFETSFLMFEYILKSPAPQLYKAYIVFIDFLDYILYITFLLNLWGLHLNYEKMEFDNQRNIRAQGDIGLFVVDHIDAMLAYWDKDQICRFANSAYIHWFGKGRTDMIGKVTMSELLGPIYENNLPYINGVLAGIPQKFEREIIMPSGERRSTLSTYSPDEANGRIRGFFVHVADITDQKRTETELKESNERNKIFVQQSPGAIAMFDTDMHYMAFSDKWIQDYHLEGQEILGKSHYEIFPEIGDDWKSIHQECLTGKINKSEGTRFVRADGTIQWLTWDVRPWYVAAGQIGGILMYTGDITEQKKREEERIQLQQMLSQTNEVARIGSWYMDILSSEIFWSSVTRDIHDVPDTYVPDLSTAINFLKEGRSRNAIIAAVDQAMKDGTPYDLQLILVTPSGIEKWVRAIGKAEFNNGICTRLYGTFQDIDSSKRTQIELKISEEKFRGAFEYSAIGMALVSLEGRWLKVNKKLCQILGYDQQELLLKVFADLTHPDDLEADMSHLQNLLAGSIESYSMEKRYYHKTGHLVWVRLNVSLVRDTEGEALHFVSQIKDITDTKIAEESLKKLNRELTAIFNSGTQVSIIGTTIDGTITHFSKGAETLLGYSASEMVGRQTPAIIHLAQEVSARGKELSREFKREIKGFDAFVEDARQGRYDSREWTYIRKDGTTFPVQLVVTAIKGEEGEVVGFLGIGTDLTERKWAEQTIRKNRDLEIKNKEMEQFTYVASHDLREPLVTVTSCAEQLQKNYSGKFDEEGEMYLHYMVQSTNRMMALINGLLDYSRIGIERHLEELDSHEVLEAVISDLGVQINNSDAIIEIGQLPVVNGYKTELRILFQNLISNAIKFRRADVPLTIKVTADKIKNGWQFQIKDNGIGIKNTDKDKIFVIFKRLHTRNEIEGNGIGRIQGFNATG